MHLRGQDLQTCCVAVVQPKPQKPARPCGARAAMSTFIKDELELAIKESLEQIVDHFHLDEVGSPYMELHAYADGMLDGGAAPKLGDVRVWHPRADTEDSPAVEKLVHLKFSVKSLTSQWLFAFSSGNSLVPHFSLGLSTSGFSDVRRRETCGTSGVHVDLISKVPLSSSEAYTQHCYQPLTTARDNILSTLSALPTHGAEGEEAQLEQPPALAQLEIDTMQRQVASPYLLAVQMEEQLEGAAAPLVVGGVQVTFGTGSRSTPPYLHPSSPPTPPPPPTARSLPPAPLTQAHVLCCPGVPSALDLAPSLAAAAAGH